MICAVLVSIGKLLKSLEYRNDRISVGGQINLMGILNNSGENLNGRISKQAITM